MSKKYFAQLNIAVLYFLFSISGCENPSVFQEVQKSKILFSSDRDGNFGIIPIIKNYDIFIMDLSGDNQINLTNSPDSDFVLVDYSSSGNKILYRNYDRTIYFMDLDDNFTRVISSSNFPRFDASFSPDGNDVVYVAQSPVNINHNRNDIILFSLNNFEEINLTISSGVEGVSPKISPLGDKICFVGRTDEFNPLQIYSIGKDGSNLTRLTNDSLSYYNVIFSKDGRKLYFTGWNGFGHEIFSLNIDNGDLMNLTNNDFNYSYFDCNLASDNRSLLTSRYVDPFNSDIFLIDILSFNITQLTFDGASLNGKFSKDGEKIIYISKVNDLYQVFKMNLDGANKKNLSNNFSNNIKPRYIP